MHYFSLAMFLGLVLTFSQHSLAGSGHDHSHGAGPNGGPVKEFGDYHVEGIAADTGAGVYFLDAGNPPKMTKIKSHSGGVLTVVPKKGKLMRKKIKAGKNLKDVFIEFSKGTKIKKIMIKLKVKGKTLKANFKI